MESRLLRVIIKEYLSRNLNHTEQIAKKDVEQNQVETAECAQGKRKREEDDNPICLKTFDVNDTLK